MPPELSQLNAHKKRIAWAHDELYSSYMDRTLPPLERLRAFEAAARLGSFGAAALELSVTPSAISHRIRALEATLGRQLFARFGPSVTLNAEGQRLSVAVRHAMDSMALVWGELQDDASAKRLRVSCAPLFAVEFILKHLAGFEAAHSEIALEIESSHAPSRLEVGECDIAIRLAERPDPTFECTPLMTIDAIAVAAPHQISGKDGDDLMRGPLLAITHMPGAWLAASAAWRMDLPKSTPLLWFDSLETIVRRVEEGAGFGLVPQQLVRDQLASGSLAPLSALAPVPGPTYWLMTRSGEGRERKIRIFKTWIENLMKQ
jgi:LysR family glycine cleavage system transcriptional activator